MRRLLVINPNTSQTTTDRLAQHIPHVLAADTRLTCITARFGASYIACDASYAVAGHAMLDAWATFLQSTPADQHPDRVLIGCFGDPGLHALRESAACPVTGPAEAAFIEASAIGPFAVVTGGERWGPMLQRIAQSLGFAATLKHLETVRETGAELFANPEQAVKILTLACQRAEDQNVKSIILGGAGLAGYAALVQPSINLPVIDSVLAGGRVATGNALPPPERNAPHFDVQWQQMPDAMMRLSR